MERFLYTYLTIRPLRKDLLPTDRVHHHESALEINRRVAKRHSAAGSAPRCTTVAGKATVPDAAWAQRMAVSWGSRSMIATRRPRRASPPAD